MKQENKHEWYNYDLSNIDIKDYKYKPWGQVFPDYKVKLYTLTKSPSWLDIFKKFDKDIKEVEENLDIMLKSTEGTVSILPHPHLVFNTFNMLDISDVKVVILGQDPYPNMVNNTPQATGMSFSVPKYIPPPKSLINIYKNMIKYNNMHFYPKHGDLSFWNLQGCLMLNSALTLQQQLSGSHLDMWVPFTDNIIKYISKHYDHVVFILWGGPALKKKPLIDSTKHKLIISSHPSPLSCSRPLQGYPAFDNHDVFGKTNKQLIKWGLTPIIWQVS